MLRRLLVLTTTVIVLVAAGWYLVMPPVTDSGYRHQARQTLSSLRSQLATAEIWGRQLDLDRSPLPTVQTGLDEMESDATATLDQFAAYQPTAGQEQIREQVTSIGDDVVAALGQLRVAARSGDRSAVVTQASDLKTLLNRVDAVDQEVAA